MFGRPKKEKSKNSGSAQGVIPVPDPVVAKNIHVMPQRFYVAGPKKSRGPLLLIILAVLVVAGLVVAGIVLTQRLSGPAVDTSTPVSPAPTTENQNTAPVVIEPTPPLVTEQPTSTPTSTPITTPTTTPEQVVEPVSGQPPIQAEDADNDLLTAAEETLFGTNPAVADTDGDGYTDGNELLSGYDPTHPATALSKTVLVTPYKQSHYTIGYPTSWRLSILDSDGTEVVFQAATGEFVEAAVIANPQQLSLTDWFEKNIGSITGTNATTVVVGSLSAIRTGDQLNYYLVGPNNPAVVYGLTYSPGPITPVNFMTTFNLMVKSFKIQ